MNKLMDRDMRLSAISCNFKPSEKGESANDSEQILLKDLLTLLKFGQQLKILSIFC